MVLLFVGALITALGVAFLVIGVSIGTESPAPYMPQRDKTLLVVLSAAAIVVGALVIRAAGKVVGW